MPGQSAGPPVDGDPRLASLLAEMVAAGAATAASLILSQGGAERAARAGWARLPGPEGGSPGRPLGASDRFDLASLTKPLCASAALRWSASGRLPLSTRLGEIWETVAAPVARLELGDLLRHGAGFARWTPLYLRCGSRAEAVELLLGGSLLVGEPGGYTDLDSILWGATVERALGEPLAELVEAELHALGEPAPRYHPPADQAVECRMDGAREQLLAAGGGWEAPVLPPPAPGEPQDGNVRFLGGAAGHAGLFASAEALWRAVREWLRPGGWLPERAVREALTGESPCVLGWTRPAAWKGVGRSLPAAMFGHLGFTGGSVWFEPEAERALVLVAHRASSGEEFDPWRRRVHSLLTTAATR
jgi:serine-type D-Ala-D-Ala carboxypeptidase